MDKGKDQFTGKEEVAPGERPLQTGTTTTTATVAGATTTVAAPLEPPQVPKAWQAHRVLKTGVNKGYFGKTGCTKGFAEVIGVNAKTIKALGHEGQVRWLQRIFLVMERLWPVEVLGERWVPLELQTVEWASCEFSKADDRRVSYPTPGLKRRHSKTENSQKRHCKSTQPALQEGTEVWADSEAFGQKHQRIVNSQTMFRRQLIEQVLCMLVKI